MTYEQAYEKLIPVGQEHLLQYYDELEQKQKEYLLKQIEDLDLSLLDLIKDGAKEVPKGKLEPLGAVTLQEIQEKKEQFEKTGIKALQQSKVGAVLLAGGQKGRRFILPHSKVMIHEPLIMDGFGGSATTIEKKAKSILETKFVINSILAESTGKTIEEIDRATAYDNVMNADAAVDFGICDTIRNIY